MKDTERADPSARAQAPGRVLVWLFTGIHAVLLFVAAIGYPVFRAPDEPAHLDMVLAMAQGEEWPQISQRMVSERVRSARQHARWDPGDDLPLAAADAERHDARIPFAALGPDEPSQITNQMPQHPPGYYWLAGQLARVMGADDPDGASLGGLVTGVRLFTAAFVLPLPYLAFRSSQALGFADADAVAAAAVTVGIPQLTHIGAAVNNDAPLILAGAALSFLLLRVIGGRLRWPDTVLVGATDAPSVLRTPKRLGPWVLARRLSAMAYRSPYSEEFKQRALRLVDEMGLTPQEVAEDLGCSSQAIRDWRRQAKVDAGEQEGISTEERARLRELERDNRRLREERDILKAAAAYFAQETNGTR